MGIGSLLFGVPVRRHHVVEVPRALSREEIATLLEDLRGAFEQVGMVQEAAGSVMWVSTSGMARVTITATAARTVVRLEENYIGVLGGLVGGGLGGIGGGGLGLVIPLAVALGLSGLATTALVMAWLGAVALGVRLVVGGIGRRSARRLQRARASVEDRLGMARSTRALGTGSAVAVPALDEERARW